MNKQLFVIVYKKIFDVTRVSCIYSGLFVRKLPNFRIFIGLDRKYILYVYIYNDLIT